MEGMRGIENHYQYHSNNSWKQGETLGRTRIFAWPQSIFPKIFISVVVSSWNLIPPLECRLDLEAAWQITDYGKGKTVATVGRTWQISPYQVVKANITSDKLGWYNLLYNMMCWKSNFYLLCSSPKSITSV